MAVDLSASTNRLAIRLALGGAVGIWVLASADGRPVLPALALVAAFALFSAGVWRWELRRDGEVSEPPTMVFAELGFIGLLVFLTGGLASQMHHLFYLVLALRAPYAGKSQSLAIPAAASAIYLAAVGEGLHQARPTDLAVPLGIFWLLSPLLRSISVHATGERERAEQLASALSATHDEVRRYTAALERAGVQSERRLAQVTLLHRFATDVRRRQGYEAVYRSVLEHLEVASEAPWALLLHRDGAGQAEAALRHIGDPPPPLVEWFRGPGASPSPSGPDGGAREVPGEGKRLAVAQVFARWAGEAGQVVAAVAFPPGQPSMEKAQVETVVALMDAVALELEVVRLQERLREANAALSESNRNLLRLHELQAQLSRAFLAARRLDGVIQGIQEIMAKELFELDRLNLFLAEEDGRTLRCRTSVGIGDYPVEQIRIPTDERGGALALAFREGRTIFFDGRGAVPADLRLAYPFSRIPALRSRIFVIVPLVDHLGNVLGVIGADRKHSHQPIPQGTVTMLEFFAHHVAMALAAERAFAGTAARP